MVGEIRRTELSTKLPPRPVEEGDIISVFTTANERRLYKVTGVTAVGQVSLVDVESLARPMKLDESGRLKDA